MLKTILSLKGGKEGKDKLTSKRIDLLRAPFHAKDLLKKKLTLELSIEPEEFMLTIDI